MHPPPRLVALLAALTAVSLAVRLVGVDAGLPHRGEPDPYVIEQVAGFDTRGLLDRSDAGWKYPTTLAWLVAATTDPAPAPDGAAGLDAHLAAASDRARRVRVVCATLAAFAAPVTALLARAVGLGASAWLAGWFVAASLLHVTSATQARPHAAAATFSLLALLALARYASRPTAWRALGAGLGAASAVATLHSGALVLPAALAGWLAAWRRRGARGALSDAAVVLACVGAAALHAYWPGARLRALARVAPPIAVHGVAPPAPAEPVAFSGHVVDLARFDGAGFGAALRALGRHDPWLLALAALAAAAWVAERACARRAPPRPGSGCDAPPAARGECAARVVVATFGVTAVLVLGFFGNTAARLLVAPVAVLALPAAAWLEGARRSLEGAGRWAAGRAPRAAVVLVALAVVAPATRLAWLRGVPDTVARAAGALGAWPEASVACFNLPSIPLFQREVVPWPEAEVRTPWERYQSLLGAADGGATAARLGRPLRYPRAAELVDVLLAPDRVACARALVARCDADLVLLARSVPPGAPSFQRELVEAIAAAVAAEGYSRLRTFEAHGQAEVGYQVSLREALTARALGPRVEVWHRPSR